MTVSAHFDGKVIVPGDRFDLPPNQALIVQIERSAVNPLGKESVLTWWPPMLLTARRCLPISRTGTTTTFTAVPPRTSNRSGHLLRGRFLLDRYIQQAGSVSFPSRRLASVVDADG